MGHDIVQAWGHQAVLWPPWSGSNIGGECTVCATGRDEMTLEPATDNLFCCTICNSTWHACCLTRFAAGANDDDYAAYAIDLDNMVCPPCSVIMHWADGFATRGVVACMWWVAIRGMVVYKNSRIRLPDQCEATGRATVHYAWTSPCFRQCLNKKQTTAAYQIPSYEVRLAALYGF